MNWNQVIDPFRNIALSALVAILPILFIFWALIVRKMKGYKASLMATAIAILIAIFVYGMPVKLALLSTANGALYGLFPICWIVITAVFLFNITVKSGQFEIIKHFMASITSDRRLQALLIAFSFGSFLEGTAGFGAPVAITAAMLVGLGFNPLYAAGICLIANTAPVAFGAIGIPITVASQVTSIPEMAISQMANASHTVSPASFLPGGADVGTKENNGSTAGDPCIRCFICIAAMVLLQLSRPFPARCHCGHRLHLKPCYFPEILEAEEYLEV